jgi:alpha-2-macroglobulin
VSAASSAFSTSSFELGSAGSILGPGQQSEDPYRMTPDELYHMGIAQHEAGDLAAARQTLSKLLATTRLKDRPAREAAQRLFRMALAAGDAAETVRHFETVKERWPDTVLSLREA